MPNTLSKMKVANVDFHYIIKKTALKNETNIHSFIASYSHEKSAQDIVERKSSYRSKLKNSIITKIAAIVNS